MTKLNVLKGKLTENEKTYTDCANALTISLTSFCEKINGRRKFTVEEASILGDFLNLEDTEKIQIFLS